MEERLQRATEKLNKELEDVGPSLISLSSMDNVAHIAEYVQVIFTSWFCTFLNGKTVLYFYHITPADPVTHGPHPPPPVPVHIYLHFVLVMCLRNFIVMYNNQLVVSSLAPCTVFGAHKSPWESSFASCSGACMSVQWVKHLALRSSVSSGVQTI